MFGVIYYLILILSIVMFIIFHRRYGLRTISYTVLMYVLSVILIQIPGYQISLGEGFEAVSSRGFDLDIYLIYISFIILTPAGLMLGNLCGKNIGVRTQERKYFDIYIVISLIFIIVYSLAYFTWLPEIPLNSMLKGDVGILEVTISRVAITHQLSELMETPFVFRYWRNFLQSLFLIIFLYVFLKHFGGSLLEKLFIFLLFVYLGYCFLFTLEKAPFLEILIAIFMVSFIQRKFPLIKFLIFIGIFFISTFAMYIYFMGVELDNYFELFSLVWERLGKQSVSTYFEIEYIRENGFLLLNGIKMPIINKIFILDYVDIGRWAYEVMFPGYTEMGTIGAAGGMSLAELYFCFSWFSLPLFFIFTIIYGFFDAVFLNAVFSERSTEKARKIHLAFYAAISALYSFAISSSVFMLFAFPTIFNPSIFFILALYCCIFDVRKTSFYFIK
jgi:hypothetical protein